MRRKRFQHQASNLTHMFCGWQIHGDWEELTRMGSGELEIDVLTGDCRHDGLSLPSLGIAGVLRTWLEGDLQGSGIPRESVDQALLVVDFVTRESDTQRDPNTEFPGAEPPFVHCDLVLRSLLVSGLDRYEATREDALEWPKGSAR